jgi:hypothetical protein
MFNAQCKMMSGIDSSRFALKGLLLIAAWQPLICASANDQVYFPPPESAGGGVG